MRMLDEDNDKRLDNVLLVLTAAEARQLNSYLCQLIDAKSSTCDHFHLSSEDYQKEITICLYSPDHINNFNHRIRKLIVHDE
jgi:hypothetical protein